MNYTPTYRTQLFNLITTLERQKDKPYWLLNQIKNMREEYKELVNEGNFRPQRTKYVHIDAVYRKDEWKPEVKYIKP
jgi:hypothetical protein